MMIGNPFSSQNGATQGVSTDPNVIQAQPAQVLDNGAGKSGSINDPNNKGNNQNNQDDGDKGDNSDDPLKDLGTLWDDPVDKDGKPIVNNTPKTFLPDVNPKDLEKMIANMDFTKGISQEQLTAIQTGGEAAAKALPQILNTAIRQAMALSFTSSKRMMESGLSVAQGRFLETVPSSINSTLARNDLESSNPLLSDPLFAPMVDAYSARVREKFPKASAKQVASQVNAIFEGMQKKLTSGKDADKDTPDNSKLLATGAGGDWAEWLEPKQAA